MIEITPTLTEDQRALLAARIYFEAFRRKLASLIGQPTLTLIFKHGWYSSKNIQTLSIIAVFLESVITRLR